MKLTDVQIRRAKPGAKGGPRGYKLGDGRGLSLLVTRAGGKSWRWDDRVNGRQKTMTLGRFPEMRPAEARELHAEARKLKCFGVDPMEQRKSDKATARAADTDSFASVARLWWEHWKTDKSERHADTTWERMKANVLPKLGARPIREMEAPELVAMVKAIEERGAGDIAKRALQTVGQVFRHAVAHGYAQRNPAYDFKPSDVLRPTRAINYARVDGKEVGALLRAIEAYRGGPVTRLAMNLIALPFVRTKELIGAEWEEFDFEEARWNIPKERMKSGKPHIVPLSRQALDVLGSLRELGDGRWVFPGEKRGRPIPNMTILKGLERMGYKGRMTGRAFVALRPPSCMSRATRMSILSSSLPTRDATR